MNAATEPPHVPKPQFVPPPRGSCRPFRNPWFWCLVVVTLLAVVALQFAVTTGLISGYVFLFVALGIPLLVVPIAIALHARSIWDASSSRKPIPVGNDHAGTSAEADIPDPLVCGYLDVTKVWRAVKVDRSAGSIRFDRCFLPRKFFTWVGRSAEMPLSDVLSVRVFVYRKGRQMVIATRSGRGFMLDVANDFDKLHAVLYEVCRVAKGCAVLEVAGRHTRTREGIS